MNILLLEDYRALRFALTQVLEDAGHTARAAASITQAAKLIEAERFDLLLLDLVIGDDLSTQVADLAGYRLPKAEIIYLTGSDRFPNGELFEISRNASFILRKPVDLVELLAIVTHLGRSLAKTQKAGTSPVVHLETSA